MNIYVCEEISIENISNVYVGDSLEEAVEFFRSQYLPKYEKLVKDDVWWQDQVDYWKSNDMYIDIRCYEIEKGLNFQF